MKLARFWHRNLQGETTSLLDADGYKAAGTENSFAFSHLRVESNFSSPRGTTRFCLRKKRYENKAFGPSFRLMQCEAALFYGLLFKSP